MGITLPDGIMSKGPGYGPSRAKVLPSGTPIWALIGAVRYGQSIADTAAAYGLTHDEMMTAIEFYIRYHEYIDAQILLNNEPEVSE